MKGIIFREFLNMVENEFGYETVDTIIQDSNLSNKGAYTSVGTYDHKELFQLVSKLCEHSNSEAPTLLHSFGEKAFTTFSKTYSSMFANINSGFQFLSLVENTIHVEVLKLYPEAELPHIKTTQQSDSCMILTYNSKRKMSDFAAGLIAGCMNYFGHKTTINKTNIEADGSIVEFTINMV